MTNINSAAPTAPIVHEAPSLLRLWWKNKELQNHIAIATVIIIFNIQAIVYMIIQKLPTPFNESLFTLFGVWYFLFGIVSCVYWLLGIKKESARAEFIGWIGHFIGFFCILLYLLYNISPLVCLFFGLNIGLPGLVWLIVSKFGQDICKGLQKLRDWWMSVKQPQLVVTSQGGVPV